ncbi:MAG: type I glutamate--ammonia ligase [Bacteroidales bacterium]|nr:type I glutamate--ammonia ligase [Bacteroidales bacterium]MBS3774474.1 type I glutamate--ammonia ligase [Bacteroidales bacterium]
MTPTEFFNFAKENGAEMVDLKFTDLLGSWQHCTFPVDTWDEDTFKEGVGFDGSSIRGWQDIHMSDMVAIPDPSTAKMDPFFAKPTVSVIADVYDPVSLKPYTRDPRYVAQKGIEYLKKSGLGDTCFIGPEPEFFIFDEIRYDQRQNLGMYQIDSNEGAWNTNRIEEPNLGYKPSYKGGYFPVSPTDTYHDMRGEMVDVLRKLGLVIEAHHHEVGTGGQSEIDMKFADLLTMADQFMWFKYVVKNVAKTHNKTVTFMPKPIFQDNGSGMHTHLSLWKEGKPMFAGDKYAGLSQEAVYGMGGVLKHAASLLAFAAPTTNSYRRLVPGFEAPVNLAYSQRNRSAAVRIPMYSKSPKAKRFEFRCPDPTANGYLMFTAMLMATLDGIENKIDPGKALDKDIYSMNPEELAKVPKVPGSLDEALEALEKDYEYLTKGDVFTDDLITNYVKYKKENELNELASRPHPYEFFLYYDN